jgi:hypothetical protein
MCDWEFETRGWTAMAISNWQWQAALEAEQKSGLRSRQER